MPDKKAVVDLWKGLAPSVRLGVLVFAVVATASSTWITAYYAYRGDTDQRLIDRGAMEFAHMERLVILLSERVERLESINRHYEERVRHLEERVRNCPMTTPSGQACYTPRGPSYRADIPRIPNYVGHHERPVQS